MSNSMMNHDSHTQDHQQQQQQQQKISETSTTPTSSSVNSTTMTLTRSDSTSTVILEEEETRSTHRSRTTLPASFWANLNVSLRSLLKTSGRFNDIFESSDKFNDLFNGENTFTLQRLLSEAGADDLKLDMNDFIKLDSGKLIDSRTLSEFIRSESFDQLIATAIQNNELRGNSSSLPCSSNSFSELRPVSPEFLTENYPTSSTMEIDQPTSSSMTSNVNQGTLNAVEHDHAFLCKRAASSSSTTTSESLSSTSSASDPKPPRSNRTKRSRNVNRAKDIKSSDDLSYYLERRRKNNEASKVSRAVRKQKFHHMDRQCEEYERVNAELRKKIATLETVTTNLKSGLVHNFQRKDS